jgi:hypothetical protein
MSGSANKSITQPLRLGIPESSPNDQKLRKSAQVDLSTRANYVMNVVGKVIGAAILAASCALHGMRGAAQGAPQAAAVNSAPSSLALKNIAFIEAPEIRTADIAQMFPRGSRLVSINLGATGKAPKSLSIGFFAAADPQVSADGSRLLFAAQTERNTTWQIWDIPAEGGTPRQITHCVQDCVQPQYLPANQIVYTALEGAGAARASTIWVTHDDGTSAHPITFGPGRFEIETVLRSGRLLLSADSPLVAGGVSAPPRNLYVVDPDGSGLMLLRRYESAPGIRRNAQELADGTILFVQHKGAQLSAGQLMAIRPGAPHATPIAPGHSGFASVAGFGEGTIVASRRNKDKQFDLYLLSLHGSDREQLLYRESRTSSIQAVLIAPRPMVEAYRSILHPERTTGRMICLDAYASKDVATGRIPGHITRVRVVTRTQTGEKLLGEAPVEVDGSFYAAVPADLPIRFLLIGSNGEILKQQRSWMWVRPGEDRGCFGCHEGQALAPENRSPMTLQRLDTPTLLMRDVSATPKTQKAVRP